MKLLTERIKSNFPKIGETSEKKPEDVKVIVKYFCPWNNWTWYATEFDGKNEFFGYVKGFCDELGYFLLSELLSIRGPGGLTIERDLYFGEEHTLKEVMSK